MSIEASSVVLLEGAAGKLADNVEGKGQPVEVEPQVWVEVVEAAKR